MYCVIRKIIIIIISPRGHTIILKKSKLKFSKLKRQIKKFRNCCINCIKQRSM
jgi:hypothetical protein